LVHYFLSKKKKSLHTIENKKSFLKYIL